MFVVESTEMEAKAYKGLSFHEWDPDLKISSWHSCCLSQLFLGGFVIFSQAQVFIGLSSSELGSPRRIFLDLLELLDS